MDSASTPNAFSVTRLLFLLLAAAILWLSPKPALADGVGCKALAQIDLTTLKDAPSQVITTETRAAAPARAAACIVDGYTNRNIGWRLFLPPLSAWNGKMVQEGCGGRCGARRDEGCEMLALRGYACAAADLGHKGTNYDSVWAIDNPLAEVDFGFRATHVTNIVARAVIAAYYGRAPAHVYYTGISTGGRQGLVEAQRFPRDFDGIVIGEPAMNRGTAYGALPSTMAWASSILAPGDKAIIGIDQIRAVHAAVLALCDKDDFIVDGIVGDPANCRFDPATLACDHAASPSCLTPVQVAALRQLYAGETADPPVDLGRRFLPGSELTWIDAYVSKSGTGGTLYPRGANPYAYAYAGVFNESANVDLRPFAATGAKMILYQGLADEIALPGAAIDYYSMVERVIGSRAATAAFLRFFLVPGMSHTPGSAGAEVVDYVTVLENWVERGEAPDRLIGHHLKDPSRFLGPNVPPADLAGDNLVFTRPIYVYPLQARYRGKGDPAQWQSFAPWDPDKHRWARSGS